jgi:hypothetical protein
VLTVVLEVVDGRRPAAPLGGVAAASVLRYAGAARMGRRAQRVSKLTDQVTKLCRAVVTARTWMLAR